MDKDETLKLFGERVTKLRTDRGLSQRELAHSMGKDHPAINIIEKGKVNPSFWFLLELASGLGITIEELVKGFDLPAKH